jgi:hypothetical protein
MALLDWDLTKVVHLSIAPRTEELVDFPILVNLSVSSGQTGFDCSGVFTELGTSSKKLAVEVGDTGVQCNVEIERWDATNQIAQLWVKVPSVSATADTILRLYFDSAQLDNTNYVGDTGSAPAQAVWDTNFVAVYHLSQDPSIGGACVLDSTLNAHHGTPNGSMTSDDLVSSDIGLGLSLDGSNDYIDIGVISPAISAANGDITFESLAKRDVASTTTDALFSMHSSAYAERLILWQYGTSASFTLSFWTTSQENLGIASLDVDTLYKTVAARLDNTTLAVTGWVGDAKTSTTATKARSVADTDRASIGQEYDGSGQTDFSNITVREIRISSVPRADEWVSATSLSNTDSLITFWHYNINILYPSPKDYNKLYGLSQLLQLTATVDGTNDTHYYDTTFYNTNGIDLLPTISGTETGTAVTTTLPTLSGTDYLWYALIDIPAIGVSYTTPTYSFYIRYLCSGICNEYGVPASGIGVNLHRRLDGQLVGATTTSSGGTFYMDSAYNEPHYIVALNPDVNSNALIFDKILPE